jgi:hypothetical protein
VIILPEKTGPSFGASGNLERKITSQARVKSTGCMMVQGRIEGVLADWKMDTGAKRSFITKETFDLIVDKPVLRPVVNNYVTANGQRLQCIGQASMTVMFAEHVFEHDIIVGGVKCNLIGEDFITMYRCVWDHDESCLVIKGSHIHLEESDKGMGSSTVIALATILVPGGHEAVIKSGLSNRTGITDTASFVGVLTPERSFLEKYGLAIAKTLVDADNEVLFTRVFNPGHTDVRVYRHTHIALFTPVSRVGPTVILNNCEPDRAYHVDKISMKNDAVPEHLQSLVKTGCRHLDNDQKEKFKNFLLKNQNCFAKPGEVGRTTLGTHNIKLKDETPVREPSRRIPMYKRHAMEE